MTNNKSFSWIMFSVCTVLLVMLGLGIYGGFCLFPSWQCQLGRYCYKIGWTSSAAFWFHKAAISGDKYSQYYYGFLCAEGLGVSKDTGEAYIWYEKAAESGLAEAQHALAFMDYSSNGTESDKKERGKSCYKWLVKAMKQNHPESYILAQVVASEGVATAEIPAEKLLLLAGKYDGNIDNIPHASLEHLRKEVGVFDENEAMLRGRTPSENIGLTLGFLEYAADTLDNAAAAGQLGGMYWNIHKAEKADKVLGITDSECVKRALHYLEKSCTGNDSASCWDSALLSLSNNSPSSKDIWIYVLGAGSLDEDMFTIMDSISQSDASKHLYSGLFSGILGMNRDKLFELFPHAESKETLSEVHISEDARKKLYKAVRLGNTSAIEYMLLRGEADWLEKEATNANISGRGAIIAMLGQYYELGDNADKKLRSKYHIGLCTAEKSINDKAAKWYRESANYGNALGEYKTGMVCQQNGDDSEAAFWFKLAAQKDTIPQPQVALGDCYYYGRGVESNIGEAIQWYKSALKYNDARAQLVLSKCYAAGNGVEKNTDLAVHYCECSALQGNNDAAYLLGKYCEKGKSEMGSAFTWYKKAADGFVTSAYPKMARCYYLGLSDENVNYKKAYDWAVKAAHVGEGEGHYWLAKCYENGHVNDKKDDSKAFYHYKMAADAGLLGGLQETAQMYIDGRGTKADGNNAIIYLKKIDSFVPDPEEGTLEDIREIVAQARFKIGSLYEVGKLVAKDLASAKAWYEKAVEGENVEAMVALGDLYYYGRGVTKDIGESFKLYKRASNLGSGEAERNIGFAYYKGEGVDEDYNLAVKWFMKAAEHRHPDGLYQLGTCYEYGRGVAEDPEMADFYYREAAMLGSIGGRQSIGAVHRVAVRKLDECCDNLMRIGYAIEAAPYWPDDWDDIYNLVGERLYCPCGGTYRYSRQGKHFLVFCGADAHSDAGVYGLFPEYGNKHGLRKGN